MLEPFHSKTTNFDIPVDFFFLLNIGKLMGNQYYIFKP